MPDDLIMVRVYLSEEDHGRRKALTEEILALLRDRHAVQGATVFRGIAGYGAHGLVHADDILRISVDLPVVVEFFDAPPAAEAAIARLLELVPGDHIVSWPVRRH